MEKLTIDRITAIVLALLQPEGEVAEFELRPDTDLMGVGLTSILYVQLIIALEGTFDVEIPDSKLILSEMNTLKKIYDVLSSLLPEERSV